MVHLHRACLGMNITRSLPAENSLVHAIEDILDRPFADAEKDRRLRALLEEALEIAYEMDLTPSDGCVVSLSEWRASRL